MDKQILPEPSCKCPRCGSNSEILSEEDDGTDRNELFWCWGCKEPFVIRTGELVDEWAQELRNMCGDGIHERKG